MDNKKIYLTKEGLADLQKEHDELTKVKRPSILSRVTAARDMGDLAENAEYTASREELGLIDGRIEELEDLLKRAAIIDGHAGGKHKTIALGSTVTVKVDGKKEIFMLVGEWEADPMEKKISHESPLGKALLGKKIGEKVEVEAPAGKIMYTIISVH
ncbi:MAG: transcription elongation factor GreA [Candidatus Levybacteria bacterium]|nr:transcription elongation factor GreA [Candidatus Levybacteria bacterium]